MKLEEVDVYSINNTSTLCKDCLKTYEKGEKEEKNIKIDYLSLKKPKLYRQHTIYLECQNCKKSYQNHNSKKSEICIECYNLLN